MRYLISILFVFALACDYGFDYQEEFGSADEIRNWMYFNITYEKDIIDDWKRPDETYRDRRGDCEDMSFLASQFLFDIGIDNYVCFGFLRGKYHCWVEFENVLYEVTSGSFYPFDIYGDYLKKAYLKNSQSKLGDLVL